MASKKTKKKKFRIKKRARRTIGSLLLVTAIIVALIPVNKTEAWVDPAVTTAVPYLDEVIEKHGFIDETETSIVSKTPDDECLMAFPLTDEKLNVVDYNGNTHSYYQINTNGMTAANAVPIFKLGELSSNGGTYTALVKYVGSRNDYNPSAISLAGDVCYNPKDKTLNSYYENAGNGTVNYVTETYTEYTDKLNNTFNILSLTREKLAYDNTDEEQAAWVKANPDPVKSDWKGHFGIDGPPSQVNNLCFEKKGIDYICDEAFKNTTTVNTINIPENLYQIGNSAFEGCYYLQNVTLGSKVSTLGRKCFADCTQLKNINIVNCSSLRTIGDGCFANAAFQSLKLPLSVEKIGAGAFYGCYNLNDSLDIKNGMFGEFENNGASKEIDIGHYLYANCTSLTNMSMYGKLRSVDKSGSVDDTFDGMFAGCNNLVKVELPASYGLNKPVTIGEMMFFGCKNLECLRIPTKHAAANDWQFITNSTLPCPFKAEPETTIVSPPQSSGVKPFSDN